MTIDYYVCSYWLTKFTYKDWLTKGGGVKHSYYMLWFLFVYFVCTSHDPVIPHLDSYYTNLLEYYNLLVESENTVVAIYNDTHCAVTFSVTLLKLYSNSRFCKLR